MCIRDRSVVVVVVVVTPAVCGGRGRVGHTSCLWWLWSCWSHQLSVVVVVVLVTPAVCGGRSINASTGRTNLPQTVSQDGLTITGGPGPLINSVPVNEAR